MSSTKNRHTSQSCDFFFFLFLFLFHGTMADKFSVGLFCIFSDSFSWILTNYHLIFFYYYCSKYDLFEARTTAQDLICAPPVHGRSPKQLDLEVIL
jgi:hypothetical protein